MREANEYMMVCGMWMLYASNFVSIYPEKS